MPKIIVRLMQRDDSLSRPLSYQTCCLDVALTQPRFNLLLHLFVVLCSCESEHKKYCVPGKFRFLLITQMDRLNASLMSCLDGFGCINIIQQWLPGVVGEDVVIDQRRFRVIKLVRLAVQCAGVTLHTTLCIS